jgi:hypothetical protein
MLDSNHLTSSIQHPAMSEILLQYEPVKPTTWAYLASLLVVALYFKFNRVLSIRNWDLVGLILFAPALLMVQHGLRHAEGDNAARLLQHIGYIWLLSVSGLFMLRLLFDAFMVRRPLLEPNLSVGGLSFLGTSLFVFLMANVVTAVPDLADLHDSQRAAHLRNRVASERDLHALKTHGPGFPLAYLVPQMSVEAVFGELGQAKRFITESPQGPAQEVRFHHVVTVRVMAILSQLAIVIGLVLVGMRHFDNIKTGIAVATLYLLLPYTAMWTGSVSHALPGALLVWALVMYRRPLVAGILIGLAVATIYYPLFLLPLWISFYWQRGAIRFLVGVAVAMGLLLLVLACTSIDSPMFFAGLRQFLAAWQPAEAGAGVWGHFWQPEYRYPILAAYVGLCLSMVLWPAQKNLGTLVGYSAAVMLGTQFWHAHSGGLALAWYLPMLLLTIFRPNLEDRVSLAVVK